MRIRKNIVVTLATLLFALTPVVAVVPAYAAGPQTPAHQGFFQELIGFLEQRFGLNANQVTAAVTDFRNQHRQQMLVNMQTRNKARLDALVTANKITSVQEQAILAEQAKLQSEYNPANLTNLTPTQRKQQMQNMQNEITAWAQSQGINPQYVFPRFGMGMRGFGHKFGLGAWGQPTATPTP